MNYSAPTGPRVSRSTPAFGFEAAIAAAAAIPNTLFACSSDPIMAFPSSGTRSSGTRGPREFEGVDLRTSQNYSWSYEGDNGNSHDTFVREVFSRDTQRDMGQPYTRSRYYHLYINGQYWGLFQTQERSEASYAATYFGGDKEDYDVIKSRAGNGGYDIEATDGTLDNWRLLWNASQSGFADDATYYRVQGLNPDGTRNPAYPKLLDVDNLIDYMICTYYVGDPDGPVSAWGRVANNFYTIFNRVTPDGFKFFRHDAEHSLDNVQESRLFASTTMAVGSSFSQSNPMWMHTRLVLHPEYKMRFADRVYKYFFNGGLLTPESATNRFMARAEQIETAIIGESARWGDSKRTKPRNQGRRLGARHAEHGRQLLPETNGHRSEPAQVAGLVPEHRPACFQPARRLRRCRRRDLDCRAEPGLSGTPSMAATREFRLDAGKRR